MSRRWMALLALAVGGFGVGLTEFVAMGLLPDMAHDLLAARYAASVPDAVAHAGWLISAYALGVVVGAPLIAALTTRLPRKTLILGLLGLFILGTLASALAPTFELVVVARFVAALPHGAYFGAAGMVAARLMGEGKQARGFAVVLSGLTIANVVGVPLITGLGQATSWRTAYLAIAAVFVATFLAVVVVVPAVESTGPASVAAELRTLISLPVWLAVATVAIGTAGLFSVYTYIAPVTVHVTGLTESAVPWTLVVFGAGMTVGNLLGGAVADRALRRSVLLGFVAVIVSVVLFALLARTSIGLFLGVFLVGGSTIFLGPALQARLIAVAPDARLMGAAASQSAMNIANSLGAALGGLTIARGLGYLSPAWVGAALGVVGLGLGAVSFGLDRRPAASARPVAGELVG